MSRFARFLPLAFVSFGLLTSVGCATTTDDSSEELGETDDALTSAAQSLVGRYYDAQVPFAGIGRLNLGPDGKYTAQVEAGGRAVCIVSPCLLPESGTWNATKRANGTIRLRLRVSGEPLRYYETSKANGELVLSRLGTTQTFASLSGDQCLDSADCSADQECGPKLCLMYCAAGDPFCCGPSTCQPKTGQACGGIAGLPCPTGEECTDDPTDSCDPANNGADCMGICKPAAPSCAGAWLDQNGTCRTPADGVYPDSCCAGPKCGNAQCAAGDVCCNALAGICTKPGMFCTQ